MTSEPSRAPHYPYPAPIDAYGNGGFRFAEMSHRGSILCLPTGIHAWPVSGPFNLTPNDLEVVFEVLGPPGFLLLGTGAAQVFPDDALQAAFARAGLGLEAMSTGSACRTYNIMLAEGRPVAAALIATD